MNYMFFPRNKSADPVSKKIIAAFQAHEIEINSENNTLESNAVLQIVRPELEQIGFDIETGKSKSQKITVPVLYGRNGDVDKRFEADGYNKEARYVLEVEAGRGYINNQFLKDFMEACIMVDVDYLCIAVRNTYLQGKYMSKDFEKVCTFFDSVYTSGRLGIPLSGLLIIGY